jgi:hypothetical protein
MTYGSGHASVESTTPLLTGQLPVRHCYYGANFVVNYTLEIDSTKTANILPIKDGLV